MFAVILGCRCTHAVESGRVVKTAGKGVYVFPVLHLCTLGTYVIFRKTRVLLCICCTTIST